jgi:hypothetical protein
MGGTGRFDLAISSKIAFLKAIQHSRSTTSAPAPPLQSYNGATSKGISPGIAAVCPHSGKNTLGKNLLGLALSTLQGYCKPENDILKKFI